MSVKSNVIWLYRELEGMRVIGRFLSWVVYARPRDRRDEAAMAERRSFMERTLPDRVTALEDQLPRILNALASCEAELERLRLENEELRKKAGIERALL
jgi:hypothetical protein